MFGRSCTGSTCSTATHLFSLEWSKIVIGSLSSVLIEGHDKTCHMPIHGAGSACHSAGDGGQAVLFSWVYCSLLFQSISWIQIWMVQRCAEPFSNTVSGLWWPTGCSILFHIFLVCYVRIRVGGQEWRLHKRMLSFDCEGVGAAALIQSSMERLLRWGQCREGNGVCWNICLLKCVFIVFLIVIENLKCLLNC